MANFIRQAHERLQKFPGGNHLFGYFIGKTAPYSGTIKPKVITLSEGHATLQMRDRKQVRNHLHSVHAIAMINLAELTSGLAFLYGMPDNARGIVTGLSIDYMKKGRGTLTAECNCTCAPDNQKREYEVPVTVRDESGDVVAKATAKWLVGPG